MKSGLLIRTGSSPLSSSPSLSSWIQTSSPAKASTPSSYHDSVTGILFPGKNSNAPTRSHNSLHLEINNIVSSSKRNNKPSMIRRAYSETDMFSTVKNNSYGSELFSSGHGSRSFPDRIPEEDVEEFSDSDEKDFVSGNWLESEVVPQELETKIGQVDDLSDNQSKIGDYYLELLKSNPGDPLLLRNYGKFLYEVERDVGKAEEYYSRAILPSHSSGPDGEVLCLYGKLIWETQKDRSRADSYFRRAVQVSPSDCFVMGAYAHFLWEAEEDDEEEEQSNKINYSASPMVKAF
ncbi:hypothetical protein MKW94_004438 [Papaver nudicaule]|uniref:TmcB/TmcC TPR repeats domain-containing protein n=1 Tax=Papaver nudicaule TaxID=74823 RepID=A0AA41RS25_PAPNU|nr:hypothetical protein [Papaver nudicaule]